MTPTLSKKPPAFEKILFIDGISRSGKKLTCRVLSNFCDVDYFQYRSFIEKICYLHSLEAMAAGVAVPLLQAVVDEAVYCRAIGRDLNTRESDETSVLKAFDSEEYLHRSTLKDGKDAMDRFNASGRHAAIHLHHTMPTANLLFKAFPHAKLAHVMRHPIDLAEDWLRRGWGERQGTDPLAFGLQLDGGEKPVPWFARDWTEEYLSMTPAERCIESILFLQDANHKGYEHLSDTEKRQVCLFPFEHLVTNPDQTIGDFADFLDSTPHQSMAKLLSEENCPRTLSVEGRRENLRKLEAAASSGSIVRLKAAGKTYEDLWKLAPL